MREGAPNFIRSEENMPKREGRTRDVLSEIIKGEGLSGISASLEKVYGALNAVEALRLPEFRELQELVEDFQGKARKENGTPPDTFETIQALRIIAKEQGWNENHWNWDVICKEAERMGYEMKGRQKTGQDIN